MTFTADAAVKFEVGLDEVTPWKYNQNLPKINSYTIEITPLLERGFIVQFIPHSKDPFFGSSKLYPNGKRCKYVSDNEPSE